MTVKQAFNTSAELDYPTVLPTLDLDFANSKILDPRITFTRASGGSYVGVDGLIKYAGVNETRFDHDPLTGESLGLLVEEGKTNIELNSSDTFLWPVKSNMVPTGNAIVLPDGSISTTVEYRGETTAPNAKLLRPGPSGAIVAGETWSFSVFLRYGTEETVHVVLQDNVAGQTTGRTFNLLTGNWQLPQGFFGGTTGSSGIERYPNGWYRVWVSCTFPNSATGIQTFIRLRGNLGEVPFTTSFAAWGAQLERGAFPTSYIPTQASTRTRQPDNATMSGRNFSEWYNQSEGTLFANAISRGPFGVDGYNRVYDLTDGTSLNGIGLLRLEASNVSFYESITNNNVLPFFQNFTTNNSIPILHAMTFKQNYFYRVVKESTGRKLIYNPSIRLTLPILNRLGIGCEFRASTGRHLNGTISKLRYYPRALTPSQLQSLTE